MQLSIQDCIKQYKALREREPDIAQTYYKLIEAEGKRLFRLHHVPWDEQAEGLLKSAIEYYNSYLGVSFTFYLLTGMRNVYSHLKTDPDDFYCLGYQGTGFSKFQQTGASNPERLMLQKIGPADSEID